MSHTFLCQLIIAQKSTNIYVDCHFSILFFSRPKPLQTKELGDLNCFIELKATILFKVYYEDPTSGAMDYLEENLEEFGLEVIADIKFHPSGGGI